MNREGRLNSARVFEPQRGYDAVGVVVEGSLGTSGRGREGKSGGRVGGVRRNVEHVSSPERPG